ncbi:transcription antitermination factor NusB [bacterium]|nr:transcription antitermination factor NusB [bacterium]
MRQRRRARELALMLLYQIDILGADKESIEELRKTFWQENPSEKTSVIDFANLLVTDTIKNLKDVDAEITKVSLNWKLSRMAYLDRNILRMATFEIMFMVDIPPLATINEAIEMAKKYGTNESTKFINGILHKIKEACKSKKKSRK